MGNLNIRNDTHLFANVSSQHPLFHSPPPLWRWPHERARRPVITKSADEPSAVAEVDVVGGAVELE